MRNSITKPKLYCVLLFGGAGLSKKWKTWQRYVRQIHLKGRAGWKNATFPTHKQEWSFMRRQRVTPRLFRCLLAIYMFRPFELWLTSIDMHAPQWVKCALFLLCCPLYVHFCVEIMDCSVFILPFISHELQLIVCCFYAFRIFTCILPPLILM